MVNRIQAIIQKYNISPSKLADQLGVPRSTISHILSERNKPSLEFLQKVLDYYPEISTDWLIKGEGGMFGSKTQDLFSQLETKVDESLKKERAPEKVNQPDQSHSPKPIIESEKGFPSENAIKNNSMASDTVQLPPGHESSKQDLHELSEKEINRPPEKTQKRQQDSQKKIVKLIAFYEDNTFDEFFPAKKDS